MLSFLNINTSINEGSLCLLYFANSVLGHDPTRLTLNGSFVCLMLELLFNCRFNIHKQTWWSSRFNQKHTLYFLSLMMMMRNCFCGMVDRRKAFSLISNRGHCQRSSPSRNSDMPRAGLEPAQNLDSGFVEWSWAVVITTTPQLSLLMILLSTPGVLRHLISGNN